MAEQEEMHTVVLEPVRSNGQRDAEVQFARERQAFWAMHSQLLSTYAGQYVAVLNEQVVDSDGDERTLVQRVYQTFGYQPMYVQYVTASALTVHHMMSPQVVRL